MSTPVILQNVDYSLIDTANKIHCVGIKGVGLTPVALILQDLGKYIQGSDTNEKQITDEVLAKRNISVKEFSSDNISEDIDLVIYSGAYKRHQHPELVQADSKHIPTLTQAQALALLTAGKKLIAVCGVGGKTTTSAMLATIFQQAHLDPSWFVGVSSFNKDWVPGKLGAGQYFIAEADEFAIAPPENNNPKFSLYQPDIIVCTNLLHDHPDIYPGFSDVLKVYVEFFNKLPADGLLVIQPKHYNLIKNTLTTKAKVVTYGTKDSGASHIIDIFPDDSFCVSSDIQVSPTIFVNTLGIHNLFNAATGYLVASACGIDPNIIAKSIAQFGSSKRRLEKIAYQNDILYYDDYGHHPVEIVATLNALKKRFPNRRLITIFNPHTFSRTKVFFDDFTKAFSQTDILIVDDIFASAREQQDISVNSETLVTAISAHHPNTLYLNTRDKIVEYIKQIRKPGDIILTLGAGDIYQIHTHFIQN